MKVLRRGGRGRREGRGGREHTPEEARSGRNVNVGRTRKMKGPFAIQTSRKRKKNTRPGQTHVPGEHNKIVAAPSTHLRLRGVSPHLRLNRALLESRQLFQQGRAGDTRRNKRIRRAQKSVPKRVSVFHKVHMTEGGGGKKTLPPSNATRCDTPQGERRTRNIHHLPYLRSHRREVSTKIT